MTTRHPRELLSEMFTSDSEDLSWFKLLQGFKVELQISFQENKQVVSEEEVNICAATETFHVRFHEFALARQLPTNSKVSSQVTEIGNIHAADAGGIALLFLCQSAGLESLCVGASFCFSSKNLFFRRNLEIRF